MALRGAELNQLKSKVAGLAHTGHERLLRVVPHAAVTESPRAARGRLRRYQSGGTEPAARRRSSHPHGSPEVAASSVAGLRPRSASVTQPGICAACRAPDRQADTPRGAGAGRWLLAAGWGEPPALRRRGPFRSACAVRRGGGRDGVPAAFPLCVCLPELFWKKDSEAWRRTSSSQRPRAGVGRPGPGACRR